MKDYTLTKRIGAGSFGTVHLAECKEDGKQVVVKEKVSKIITLVNAIMFRWTSIVEKWFFVGMALRPPMKKYFLQVLKSSEFSRNFSHRFIFSTRQTQTYLLRK